MRKVSLVPEGVTDELFLKAMIRDIIGYSFDGKGNHKRKEYVDAEGKPIALGVDKIVAQFEAALNEPESDLVIVLCDAESEPATARWAQFRAELTKQGFVSVPEDLGDQGVVVDDPKGRRVGVWIMPNNLDKGMLEDFWWEAIPVNDGLRSAAESYVNGIPERRFGAKVTKAKLYAWLAVQKKPEDRPWQVLRISSRIIDDHPQLANFSSWLRRAFAE